jgi:hypothetical protein
MEYVVGSKCSVNISHNYNIITMPRNSFKKGNTFGGRKKGSKNKTNSKVKEQVQRLLDDNLDMVQHDLDQLEPKDRIKFLIDLMNFTIPKMKSIDATVTSVTDMDDKQIAKLERMNDLMIEIEAERGNPDVDIDEPNGELFKDE